MKLPYAGESKYVSLILDDKNQDCYCAIFKKPNEIKSLVKF